MLLVSCLFERPNIFVTALRSIAPLSTNKAKAVALVCSRLRRKEILHASKKAKKTMIAEEREMGAGLGIIRVVRDMARLVSW